MSSSFAHTDLLRGLPHGWRVAVWGGPPEPWVAPSHCRIQRPAVSRAQPTFPCSEASTRPLHTKVNFKARDLLFSELPREGPVRHCSASPSHLKGRLPSHLNGRLAKSDDLDALQTEEDIPEFLAAGTHPGGASLDFQMEQHIYRRNSDESEESPGEASAGRPCPVAIENAADVSVPVTQESSPAGWAGTG